MALFIFPSLPLVLIFYKHIRYIFSCEIHGILGLVVKFSYKDTVLCFKYFTKTCGYIMSDPPLCSLILYTRVLSLLECNDIAVTCMFEEKISMVYLFL